MEIFQNPWIVLCVLAMPLVIIGVAKSWQRIKDKAAAAQQAQSQKEVES
jgi:hypothetical protein